MTFLFFLFYKNLARIIGSVFGEVLTLLLLENNVVVIFGFCISNFQK
jgi:hypothetical protein